MRIRLIYDIGEVRNERRFNFSRGYTDPVEHAVYIKEDYFVAHRLSYANAFVARFSIRLSVKYVKHSSEFFE